VAVSVGLLIAYREIQIALATLFRLSTFELFEKAVSFHRSDTVIRSFFLRKNDRGRLSLREGIMNGKILVAPGVWLGGKAFR